MEQKTISAEKGFLKKSILAVLLFAILSLLLFKYVSFLTEQLDSAESHHMALNNLIFILRVITTTTSLAIFSMGAYLLYLGARVRKANQFPYPGMRVVNETKIRTGSEAKSLSAWFFSFSCILLFCGVAAYFYFFSVINQVQKALAGP